MKTNVERKTLITVFTVVMGILILAWMTGLCIDPTGYQRHVVWWGLPFACEDFHWMMRMVADNDPYGAGSMYLPLCHLLTYPFACLDDYSSESARQGGMYLISLVFYMLISVAVLFFPLYKLGKSTNSTLLILVLLFFSSVNLYAVDSGNLTFISAAAIAVFLWLYNSPQRSHRGLVLVCLTVGAVIKIYPVLFGLLLLFDKKYKSIGFCVVLGLALTILPFLFFHRGLFENMELLFSNMLEQANFIATHQATGYLFGLPALVKESIHFMAQYGHVELPNTLIAISKYIQLLLAAISIILCYFTKNNWARIAILSIIVIMIPDVSWFVRGLFFFPAIVLFFNRQTFTQKDLVYLLLFCLFLNPFQIYKYPTNSMLSNFALLLMWGLLLIDILKEVKPRLLLKKTF